MKTGPKTKPTALKILEGNPGKRALPTLEPQPTGPAPEPPAHLSAYAVEEWRRIAPGLERMGMLTVVDAGALGAYCASFGKWREAEEELEKQRAIPGFSLVVRTKSGAFMPHPLIGIANKSAADMVRYSAEFGFTPSARARLGIEIHRLKRSKFEGLLDGMRRKA